MQETKYVFRELVLSVNYLDGFFLLPTNCIIRHLMQQFCDVNYTCTFHIVEAFVDSLKSMIHWIVLFEN